ncbi:CFI-box-CTERM domain-containing protein [Clostridium magnum]|uniref:Chitinase A1 n=1 Tax=Clostridium magnum DSM 2767 TaxID=1121326 RepID=A0A162T5Y5_9CLOT|nr:CFI-box-CTERM domain-containing protein [Clostridium magnum]KZL92279.1 chitinase A1 precursor [Clostridium magnum DSM 2767]SHH15109.1 repeat-containing protein [Clostridium magnum DSM 2767]
MTHRAKIKHNYLAIFMSFIMIFSSLLINVQPIKAETTTPTIVSAMTDHIGKKITLTFDKDMADPSGSQGLFNVLVNGTSESVTSVTLGSDLKQVVLNMSKPIGYLPTPKVITLNYTRGSVAAVDGSLLESFTNQAVTNNVIYLQMVDFDSTATEIGYDTDTSDPLNPTLKYKYDNKVDYDNVKLAWYLVNGFFNPMVDDLNNHVEFYEKDSGAKVVLPNILTRPNSAATYIDGTTKNQQIVTDWYFWQIQNHAPLGLDLVSQALKPSTTYVIKIDKGFVFNNGLTTTMTYYFEFTTTADSSTKPCWETGSSVTASNVTENSLTLGWPTAQDNHGVTSYNIYKNDVLLTTVDGSTTSYDVSNLSSGTKYKFKVEAVDFANNHSSECLEVSQVTLGTPAAPAVAADDVNNTITGIDTTMEFKVDSAEGYNQYNGSNLPDLSGEHTVLVRVAAAGNNPAGEDTTLRFTTPLTIVSAETDHIGKKITLTFDRSMKDPAGTQDQFTVMAKSITALPPVGGKPKNDYVSAAVPVTSVVLGSDPKQIILSMSKWVSGPITVSYTKGSVEAADEILLESFSSKSVTDNNVTTGEMVAFDSEAAEIGYDTDTSDPLNPKLKFKYDNLIDYDNVQLAWYFYNGFPGTKMDGNVRDYVEFREKDSGEKVVLPNLLIYDGSATYKDGTQQPQRILTDWYFWQIQHYVPLGLNLVSKSLKPSTTYVVEIKKGFQFNNGSSIKKTYSFEFTTTADSSSKPYWTSGSSLVASNVTENSMTLVWPAAQDNHGVTSYNIYKNDTLLTTVDGSTTSYDVSNLSSGTEYKFKVEAVDFANNHSSECLEVTQVTPTAPTAPPAPIVTNDDTANTVLGMTAGMEYSLDGAGYVAYDADTFSAIDFSGNHTLFVRVAAEGANPAGDVTTLTFTANEPTIVNVTGITLDKTNATVQLGKNITLTVTVLPDNATNKNVTWSSSNSDVATVDQTGKVTAVKEGKATITATTEDGNITKQCEVTVIIDECFIATAAYGSKFQPSVQLLRHFRDDYLLTNNIGSAFVKFYYKNSPPIANFIAHNEVLKTTVRAFLTPFVAAVYGLYHPIVACMALVLICMLVLVKRKYKFHNKL